MRTALITAVVIAAIYAALLGTVAVILRASQARGRAERAADATPIDPSTTAPEGADS